MKIVVPADLTYSVEEVESFLFKHYLQHTRIEINQLADSMGIKNAYHENRFALINEIIKRNFTKILLF